MFDIHETVFVTTSWGYSGWFDIVDHDYGMPGDRQYVGTNADYPYSGLTDQGGFLFCDDDVADVA